MTGAEREVLRDLLARLRRELALGMMAATERSAVTIETAQGFLDELGEWLPKLARPMNPPGKGRRHR